MTIIQKYILTEISKKLGVVLVTVISLYMIVDFFEKSDNFARAGLTPSRTITFFLLNTPFIISQIAPVGLLLSVIIVFGLMVKNNEILALRSSGVSAGSLVRPVVFMGFIGAILLFFFADIVVPFATTKANRIWFKEVKGKSLIRSKEKNIWIRGNRRITHIRHYNPKAKTLYGITINDFDEDFNLMRKIDAEKGIFNDGKWRGKCRLIDLVEQKRNLPSDTFEVIFRKVKFEDLGFIPDDLKKVIKKPEEMTFKELREYIRKIESEGYEATNHIVDLYAKPAYAFVCVIMCIVGVGVALRPLQKQGIFFSITYGIVIAFLYWVSYSFCLSLGYGEMLPPLVAVWTANIVFLCLGFLILVTVE